MKLTLKDAAKRAGISERRMRYLIQNKRVKAEKVGRQWLIDEGDLTYSEARREADARKQRQLVAAVEDGLGLDEPGTRPARYSIYDLKAFQIALPIFRDLSTTLSPNHPACEALRQTLRDLTTGCHRFDRSEKAACYRAARDAASSAVFELALSEHERARELLNQIEQELMAALAGLMRRVDRRRAT